MRNHPLKAPQKTYGLSLLALTCLFATFSGLASAELPQRTQSTQAAEASPLVLQPILDPTELEQPRLTPDEDISLRPQNPLPTPSASPTATPATTPAAPPQTSQENKKKHPDKQALTSHLPTFSFKGINPIQILKGFQPVNFTPLPGIVIFPVLKGGSQRAFNDLPIIFAREYAQKMESKVPETKIYNPVYTVDELRLQGLGHAYDQIMSYYLKAGRPDPISMDYLLKQLSENNRSIARVIFVEADLDMSHPDSPTGLLEKAKGALTDSMPPQMRYFIRSRVQIFDAQDPTFPMVWGSSWSRSVKVNQFTNITPSVFADSDSQQAFARVSRQMSTELLLATPHKAYMAAHYQQSVQGQVVPGDVTPADPHANTPNFSEIPAEDAATVTTENQQAIQRILQRQNSISP